ncbi:hypothetical protein V8G54_003448 [Vigna mungo]|uniref:Uncharacterized protein n=1 Tax=Vigna mungo TaxID=3915 RepID=A0AAQ3SE52_VIGMU
MDLSSVVTSSQGPFIQILRSYKSMFVELSGGLMLKEPNKGCGKPGMVTGVSDMLLPRDVRHLLVFLLLKIICKTSAKIREQIFFSTLFIPAIMVYLFSLNILRDMRFCVRFCVEGKPPLFGVAQFSLCKHFKHDTVSSTRSLIAEA